MGETEVFKLDVRYVTGFTPEVFHGRVHLDDCLLPTMMYHCHSNTTFLADMVDFHVLCHVLCLTSTDEPGEYDVSCEIVQFRYPQKY